MPQWKRKNKFAISIRPTIWLIAFACASQLTIFSFKYEQDELNLVYGARYFMTEWEAISTAWPGIDIMNGLAGRITGDARLGCLIIGAAINCSVTLMVYFCCQNNGFKRESSTLAAAITSLWFMNSGGWTADAASTAIGIAPSLLLFTNKNKLLRIHFAIAGLCLAIGLCLKLNSFLPAYACSCIHYLWESSKACKKNSQILRRIAVDLAVFSTSFIITYYLVRALTGGKEYQVDTMNYYIWAASLMKEKYSPGAVLGFPFQVDIFGIVANRKLGSMWFLPVYLYCVYSALILAIDLIKYNNREELIRIKIVLYFLIASMAAGYSLGRGIDQRLFLIPAAVTLCAFGTKDITGGKRFGRITSSYFVVVFGFLTCLHSEFGRLAQNSEMNPLNMLKRRNEARLCITRENIYTQRIEEHNSMNYAGNDATCIKPDDKENKVAGIGGVNLYRVAGELNMVFRNQRRGVEIPPRSGIELYGYKNPGEWMREQINFSVANNYKYIVIKLTPSRGYENQDWKDESNKLIDMLDKDKRLERTTSKTGDYCVYKVRTMSSF